MTDWLTRPNAEDLASRIEQYWKLRGYYGIRTWVEPFEWKGMGKRRHGEKLWAVRSNMIGGLPPKEAT